jgi:hypothetical protein
MTLSLEHMAKQPDTVALPNYTEAHLLELYEAGMHRYGVMAAFFNTGGQILMLEHEESPKTKAGMWGPLGETSHVKRDARGNWHVEPLLLTMLRGLKEEIHVSLEPEDMWLPSDEPSILTTWPLGMIDGRMVPGGKTIAQTPIVHVSDEVAEMLVAGSSSDEVRQAAWLRPEDVQRLALLRPGVQSWIGRVVQQDRATSKSAFANPELSAWHPGLASVAQDAILHTMFASRAAA